MPMYHVKAVTHWTRIYEVFANSEKEAVELYYRNSNLTVINIDYGEPELSATLTNKRSY